MSRGKDAVAVTHYRDDPRLVECDPTKGSLFTSLSHWLDDISARGNLPVLHDVSKRCKADLSSMDVRRIRKWSGGRMLEHARSGQSP